MSIATVLCREMDRAGITQKNTGRAGRHFPVVHQSDLQREKGADDQHADADLLLHESAPDPVL